MSNERPVLATVLEHYDVRLRTSSRQMVSCPLHDDRTPSLSVNLDKGLWSCKSCGCGGDAYTLIMEKEGTDFVGARAFATALGLATGGSGGGDGKLRGNAYTGGGKLSARKGDRVSRSKYVPAWRRS
jgi:hypothetical protein